MIFRYDALGRRVGKTVNGVTTWFLYDGDHVVMDIDSATHSMKVEYSYTDAGALYAVRSATDTAVVIEAPTIGTALGTQRARDGVVLKAFLDRVGNSPLFPWGQEPLDTGFVIRYRMGAQEYDQETGLYHIGARYYDPLLGRWLSEDPIGIAGGLNLYSYAGNDPVNGRDPSGLGPGHCVVIPSIEGNRSFLCDEVTGYGYVGGGPGAVSCAGFSSVAACLGYSGAAPISMSGCGSFGGHWVDRFGMCFFNGGGASSSDASSEGSNEDVGERAVRECRAARVKFVVGLAVNAVASWAKAVARLGMALARTEATAARIYVARGSLSAAQGLARANRAYNYNAGALHLAPALIGANGPLAGWMASTAITGHEPSLGSKLLDIGGALAGLIPGGGLVASAADFGNVVKTCFFPTGN